MKNIAILGAGISGLTTAFLLKKKGYKVSIFEKSHRAGGYIGTQYKDKYVVEIGANGFLNNEPTTLDLVNQLGLHNDLIPSREDSKIRYLMFNGVLKEVPTRPQDIIKSNLLSFGARMKIFKEMSFPPKPFDDVSKKSVYEFIQNHFGDEVAENIVRSGLIGIYAGDAKLLSVEKTLNKLVLLEKEHKSLIKGFKASIKKNGKANLMSFKRGMQTLIDKLTSELGSDVHLSHEVSRVYRENNKFLIDIQSEEGNQTFRRFDEVIITLPANEIPGVAIEFLDPSLLAQFKKYPIAPVRTVTFAFKEKINFKGFGTLISPNENLNILGFLHPKDIFEGRCPEDKDLITVMMGGVFKPEVMKMSTQASFDIALKDLEKILGKLPAVDQFWIWNHAPGISQYNVDQVDFMNELSQKMSQVPGVHLNSQMLGGVSINDCIRKSFELVAKI
ncbi:MAG: protoporphyrinogen oxidase [Bdellovibrionota bacterium]